MGFRLYERFSYSRSCDNDILIQDREYLEGDRTAWSSLSVEPIAIRLQIDREGKWIAPALSKFLYIFMLQPQKQAP
jgi:hypothetical protein